MRTVCTTSIIPPQVPEYNIATDAGQTKANFHWAYGFTFFFAVISNIVCVLVTAFLLLLLTYIPKNSVRFTLTRVRMVNEATVKLTPPPPLPPCR